MAPAQLASSTSVAGSITDQPAALLLVAGLLWGYLRLRRIQFGSADGRPRRALACYALGLALLAISTCGPVAHFARFSYWVWVSQSLTLLLIVPLPLMYGRPVELITAARPAGGLARARKSRVGQWLVSPLVGPALVPLVCLATFFGPVPGWAAGHQSVAWLVQLLLVLIGAVIVLPLVAVEDRASSVAVGAAVAVGFVELLLDAVPGIVLRLSTHPVSDFFAARHLSGGTTLPWLRDQQTGGGVLWCVAELLDLPFLILVFRRWIRADAREAAEVDAALDSATDRVAAGDPATGDPSTDDPASDTATGLSDQPWFMTDPRLRDRLR